MRIINVSNRTARKVYAFKIADNEYGLSPFEQSKDNRRPIARFDSEQAVEQEALSRGVQLVWQ